MMKRSELKTVVVLIIILLALPSAWWLASRIPQDTKAKLLDNVIVRQTLPLYRSLRKMPDILFAPYLLFSNDLPNIYITIDPKDIIYLNEHLPDSSPFTSSMLDSNKVFVKASFRAGDYQAKVDIRYKGLNADHWNSFQKSYRVTFPKDKLYEGASSLNLVIPYDKRYYAELLNSRRAEKWGLLTPNFRLNNVYINGKNNGVYLVSDQWTKELLARFRVPDSANIFGVNDGALAAAGGNEAEARGAFSLFQAGNESQWKSYTSKQIDYEELDALLAIISKTDNTEFKKYAPLILDLDKFYKWDAVAILSGEVKQDFENMLMLFNTYTGRFEFIPLDTVVNPAHTDYQEESVLALRILSIDEFKNERNNILGAYINNDANLADDMAFYDKVDANARVAFLQDSAKKHNDFEYLSWIKDIRQEFIDNFHSAQAVLDNKYDYKVDNPSTSVFKGSFARMSELLFDIDQFVSSNPQFQKIGEATVLLSGTPVFSEDVLIPPGLNMVIAPGTNIYLAKGVSIISYSPINAQGTPSSPIRLRRASLSDSWGTFAVVNAAHKKSTLKDVSFDGGSGDKIDGIIFSGEAAFHNSDVDISDSTFLNAGDDDALNVKYGRALITNSFFHGNFADSIDLDFNPKETLISNNKFQDNGYGGGGGDAIDLSGSDITIIGNTINGCTDKGVSVGENSHPVIRQNRIENCDIGIASKDLSVAEITDNFINNVRVGISVYQKKQAFGGGIAHVKNTVITNAKIMYEKKDKVSEITVE